MRRADVWEAIREEPAVRLGDGREHQDLIKVPNYVSSQRCKAAHNGLLNNFQDKSEHRTQAAVRRPQGCVYSQITLVSGGCSHSQALSQHSQACRHCLSNVVAYSFNWTKELNRFKYKLNPFPS